jgi:hypothetical protein
MGMESLDGKESQLQSSLGGGKCMCVLPFWLPSWHGNNHLAVYDTIVREKPVIQPCLIFYISDMLVPFQYARIISSKLLGGAIRIEGLEKPINRTQEMKVN